VGELALFLRWRHRSWKKMRADSDSPQRNRGEAWRKRKTRADFGAGLKKESKPTEFENSGATTTAEADAAHAGETGEEGEGGRFGDGGEIAVQVDAGGLSVNIDQCELRWSESGR
jgi:hypothetical protein